MPIDTSMYSVPKLEAPDLLGMYEKASSAKVRLEQAQKLQADREAEKALGQVMQGAVGPDGQFDFGRATQALLSNPLTASRAPDMALQMLKAKGLNSDLALKSLSMAAKRQEMLGNIAAGVLTRGVAQPDGSLGLDDKAVVQGLGDLSKQFPEMKGQLADMVKRLAVMTPQERYAMVHQTALGALSGKEALDSLNSHLKTVTTPEGTVLSVDTRRPNEPARVLYQSAQKPMTVKDATGAERLIQVQPGGKVKELYAPETRSEVPGADEPLTLPKSTMPTEGVNYPGATGLGGATAGALNTLTGIVGGVAMPEELRAAEALTNLGLRTKTLMQDAVPGRPSNFLLQQLERVEVQPNSLRMGSGRAKERLEQTKKLVEAEVRRIDQDVLSRPGDFSKSQLSAARQSRSKLLGLLADYETVQGAFEKGNDPLASVAKKAVGAVRQGVGAAEKKIDAAADSVPLPRSGVERWERGPDGKPRRVQ